MNSEKQTLILAGEPVPRHSALEYLARGRGLEYPNSRLTSVAMRVDDPMLYSAANAYARTQELSGGRPRSSIIDTYA